MNSYRTMKNGYIQRQSDLMLIPPVMENKDYVQYLNDVENGAEVLPFDYAAEEKRQQEDQERIAKEQADKGKEIKTEEENKTKQQKQIDAQNQEIKNIKERLVKLEAK